MINVQRYTVIDVSDDDHLLRFEYVSKSVNALIVANDLEHDDISRLIILDSWIYVDEPTDIRNVEIDCVDYFTDYVMNIAQREREES